MEPHELPEELAAIERQLAARTRPQPSEALRGRVMAAVRRELRTSPAPARRPLTAWNCALAAAAAVILLLNLSVMSTNSAVFAIHPSGDGADTLATAEALRRLVPEMSEEQALGQAVLLRAGSGLVLAPELRPSLDRQVSCEDIRLPMRAPAGRTGKS